MKKQISLLFMVFYLLLGFSACVGGNGDDTAPGKTEGVKLRLGSSSLYTEEERSAAAEAVKKKFKEMNGCRLFSLTFAGDERCQQELQSWNRMDETRRYEEMIVFDSVFRSPKNGGGAWNANEIYTWNWMVAKTDGGWEVVNYGYA